MVKAYFVIAEHERRLLARHWLFYAALDRGQRQPVTDAQKHFVAVCREKCNPNTDHEHAYLSGKKLLSLSTLKEHEVVQREFQLTPADMIDVPLNEMPSTPSAPNPDFHEIDVDRWTSRRRTVRRYNW